MRHGIVCVVAFWSGLALAGCSRSTSGGEPGERASIRIADLQLLPGTASVGEGNGWAYVLGTFGLASTSGVDRASLSATIGQDGRDVPADFVEVDGTTWYFGLYVSTDTPAARAISARLSSGATASNTLSSWFVLTEDLDPSFGVSGMVMDHDVLGPVGLAETAQALALQPDGKIVVGGAYGGAILRRYHADGTLDPSFGQGGRFVYSNDWTTHEIRALAVQPDGRIVAAGVGRFSMYDGPQPMVLRLLPDGTLDPRFGASGVAVLPSHHGGAASAVVVQPDGKIVIAGTLATATEQLALVARYGRDGALDPSFGASGVVTNRPVRGGWDELFGVALDDSGRILVTGSTSAPDAVALPAALVMRLDADGVLDPSFGETGVTWSAFFYDTGRGVAVQPGGRILVGGSSWDYAGANDMCWVVGLTSGGAPDPSYADGGAFWTRPYVPYGRMGCGGFVVSPTGASAIAGHRGVDAVVFLLAPDGSPDLGFSADGFAAATSGSALASAVALDTLGRVVAAGEGTNHDGAARVFVARFRAPRSP